MEQTKRQSGIEGETLALQFLECRGLVLIERNFNTKFGEIDLIMRDGGTVVFVEVKSRAEATVAFSGRGALAVTPQKIQRLSRTARFYIQKNKSKLSDSDFRFDVVEVVRNADGSADCTHLPNAFGADYGYKNKNFY